MESGVFLRFDSYNFEADRKFQDGLQVLHNNCKEENKLLDMKLFFYNRFVEPIDQTSYKQWSSGSSHLNKKGCGAEQLHKTTPSDSDNIDNHTTEIANDSEAKQLSFAEVMRLVQEGKEVPGVKKLDIQPTNQSPTPAQMEKILKPWEVASVSK